MAVMFDVCTECEKGKETMSIIQCVHNFDPASADGSENGSLMEITMKESGRLFESNRSEFSGERIGDCEDSIRIGVPFRKSPTITTVEVLNSLSRTINIQ
jgi:hypothetical protein